MLKTNNCSLSEMSCIQILMCVDLTSCIQILMFIDLASCIHILMLVDLTSCIYILMFVDLNNLVSDISLSWKSLPGCQHLVNGFCTTLFRKTFLWSGASPKTNIITVRNQRSVAVCHWDTQKKQCMWLNWDFLQMLDSVMLFCCHLLWLLLDNPFD